jgi:hypothetical protein
MVSPVHRPHRDCLPKPFDLCSLASLADAVNMVDIMVTNYTARISGVRHAHCHVEFFIERRREFIVKPAYRFPYLAPDG